MRRARMTNRRLQAGIVARREATRSRIASLLEASEIEVLLGASNACALEEPLETRPPDIVVLASVSAATDTKREIRDLKRRFPQVRVVAVVPGASATRVAQVALEANADGVVYRSAMDRTLVPTVRAVGAGQMVLPQPEYRRAQPVALSHRERQVLRLAVEGMTNDSIARELFLSPSTVKSHLTSAFSKLSVRSRSEAAVILLNPDEPASRLVFGEDDRRAPVSVAAGER